MSPGHRSPVLYVEFLKLIWEQNVQSPPHVMVKSDEEMYRVAIEFGDRFLEALSTQEVTK